MREDNTCKGRGHKTIQMPILQHEEGQAVTVTKTSSRVNEHR